MRKLLSLIVCLTMGVTMLMAQSTVQTGLVISAEDGEPIIGASVMVDGTTNGTVTDANGEFSVKVSSADKTLTISYIGMESLKVGITPGKKLKIILTNNDEVLDEVMVVAFGTQKKSAFTGSAAVIDNKVISDHVTTNVANALVGTVPGLQIRGGSGAPGSSSGSINIRGIASLYAETDPLIIVDGAPYDGNLSNIPQQDIESVTVLKDAASAALYGARGAAGVILITTKRGKTQDAQITVDMKWGANTRSVQEYDKITDPAMFYETYYKQCYNYYANSGLTGSSANIKANELMMSHLGYNIYTLPEGQYLIGTNGKLNPNAKKGRSYTAANGETYYLTNDDWADAAYNSAARQEYSVTATAGNDRSSFYLSSSFLDEDGVIEYSGYKRFSTRFKGDYQAKKWLRLGANMSYVNSKTTSNPNLSSDQYGSTNLSYYTSMIAPIYPIYVRVLDANGNPTIRTDANGNPQYDYGVSSTNYPGLSRAFLQTGNPLGSNRYNNVNDHTNNFFGTTTVDIDFTSYLKFNSTNSLNWYNSRLHDYENALYGPKVGVNGQIDKNNTEILRQNYVQTLIYEQSFDKHSVRAQFGHEWTDSKTVFLGAAAQGLFSSEIQEINAAANQQYQSQSRTSEYNCEGWFGAVNYNFDEKYFLSGSYRRDASCYFDEDHQWGDFWSVGAAWMITKESFMDSYDFVDMLKLKASVGQQGNDKIGSFAYTDLYSLSPASNTQMSPTFYRIGNKDITWETTTNFNTGVDFSMFKSRLNGTVEYYNKKTTDLLFWLSVPESAGARGYYGNIGDIRNSGVEVVLSGDIFRSRDFTWNIAMNMAFNRTEILTLPESKTKQYGGFYDSNKWYQVGEGLYNYMTYAYAGVDDQGRALYWYDEDLSPAGGKLGENDTNNVSKAAKKKSGTTTEIGEASRYAVGSVLPKVTGGFSTSISAYGFDLQMSFDYQLGGKIYDSGYANLMAPTTGSANGYTFHKDILKSWSPENTSSNLPRFMFGDTNAGYTSDRFITKSNYLNFQSVTLGYTVPRRIVDRLGLSKLRFYASGENLVFWSARKGLDPRAAYDSNTSISDYAPVRTVMGGLQFTF